MSEELRAIATYAFQRSEKSDLSFVQGEEIIVLKRNLKTGWWFGQNSAGEKGRFPANYVTVVCKLIDSCAVFLDDGGEFKVSISGPQGKVSAVKTVKHFRVLAAMLDELEYFPLPVWADNVALDESALGERRAILENFLKDVVEETQDQQQIVYWLDSNASRVFGFSSKMFETEYQSAYALASDFMSERRDAKLCKAGHERPAENERELSIRFGEFYHQISKNQVYKGWCTIQKINGSTGLAPTNHLKVIRDEAQTWQILNAGGTKDYSNNKEEMLHMSYTLVEKDFAPVRAVSQIKGPPRMRQRQKKYSVADIDKFKKLFTDGYVIDQFDRAAPVNNMPAQTPSVGDTVTLNFNAFVWEPQKQDLLEFLSSDVLIEIPGKEDSKVLRSGEPLVFELGSDSVVDGIDKVVREMHQGDSIRAVIGPDFAYGEDGYEPLIPPNAYLVYDLFLEKIVTSKKEKLPEGPAKLPLGLIKAAVLNPYLKPNKKRPSHDHADGAPKKKEGSPRRKRKNPKNKNKPVGHSDYKGMIPLKELQLIARERDFDRFGIKPAIIEQYLDKNEFEEVFGINLDEFNDLPASEQRKLRKDANLY